MRDYYETKSWFYEYFYKSADFRRWQNELSEGLLSVVSKTKGEVSIVTDLCAVLSRNAFSGKAGELRIVSEKIHGTASNVEFKHFESDIKRELADMLIISAITHGQDIVVLKTAFIQNKKQNNAMSWTIEQGQLNLLLNFPMFTGISGRHIGKKEYTFLNASETLGNYGLFSENDMLLASAKAVFCAQKGKTVLYDDLKSAALAESITRKSDDHFLNMCHRHMKNCCEPHEYWYRNFHIEGNFPFWNSSFVSLNMYEFVRNFTYFNIGEISELCRTVYDEELHEFTCRILFDVFGIGVDGGRIYHHKENQPKDDSLRREGNDLLIVFNELNFTKGL